MSQEEFRKDSDGSMHPPASDRPPHNQTKPPQGGGRPPRPPHYTSESPKPSRPHYYPYYPPQIGTIIHPIPQVQQGARAAYLRFLNAIIGGGAVDVYVDGTLVAQKLEYGNVSNYATIASHVNLNHTVIVYQAGTKGNPILETRIPINRGSVYTEALGGTMPSIGLQSVSIQRMEIPTQMAILRFDHLSPNNTGIDVNLNGQKVFSCVSFWQVTSPIGLYIGSYTIELLLCGSQIPLYTLKSTNIGAGAYTLYGIGLLDGQPPFQAVLIQD